MIEQNLLLREDGYPHQNSPTRFWEVRFWEVDGTTYESAPKLRDGAPCDGCAGDLSHQLCPSLGWCGSVDTGIIWIKSEEAK